METINNDTSLIGCMREIPDPMAPYNQRHKFLDIIIIAVTAVLAGILEMRLRTGQPLKKNGWKRSLNCPAASLHMILQTGYFR